jgi:transitional endoplasmic reticulum ATPase
VPPPDEKARLEIFKVHAKNMPLKNVDLKELAKKAESFSGADIEAVCREAAMNALRDDAKANEVKMKHFEDAMRRMTPSISKDVITYYSKFVERQKKIQERDDLRPTYIG